MIRKSIKMFAYFLLMLWFLWAILFCYRGIFSNILLVLMAALAIGVNTAFFIVFVIPFIAKNIVSLIKNINKAIDKKDAEIEKYFETKKRIVKDGSLSVSENTEKKGWLSNADK